MPSLLHISSALINKNCGWRYIVLFRALIETDIFTVERADCTVGGSEIDANVFHRFTLPTITVPWRFKPSGPMIMGSII